MLWGFSFLGSPKAPLGLRRSAKDQKGILALRDV